MVRQKLYKQNYIYLKPLFYSLFVGQMIIPFFMYPSVALENLPVEYSWHKGVFFLAASLVVVLGLCSIGWALQHVELSSHSIPLCLCIVCSITAVILHVSIFGIQGTSFISGSASSLPWFLGSLVLMIVPQVVTYLVRIRKDMKLTAENRTKFKEYIREGELLVSGQQQCEF